MIYSDSQLFSQSRDQYGDNDLNLPPREEPLVQQERRALIGLEAGIDARAPNDSNRNSFNDVELQALTLENITVDQQISDAEEAEQSTTNSALASLSQASKVLWIQSLVNLLPIWKATLKEIGQNDIDWGNPLYLMKSVAVISSTDWGRNLSHTTYLQGLRRVIPEEFGLAREFLASFITCFLDVGFSAPSLYVRQAIVTSPNDTIGQALRGATAGELFSGSSAILMNNLLYMNVFFPMNEMLVKLTQSQHSPKSQMLIGCAASLTAGAVAWPAEWFRAQLNDDTPMSSSELIAHLMSHPVEVYRGFLPMIYVYLTAGIFCGLANMYLRPNARSD